MRMNIRKHTGEVIQVTKYIYDVMFARGLFCRCSKILISLLYKGKLQNSPHLKFYIQNVGIVSGCLTSIVSVPVDSVCRCGLCDVKVVCVVCSNMLPVWLDVLVLFARLCYLCGLC